MKKRFMSVVLVLALAFSLAVPALAATFTDLTGHWSEEYMLDLYDRGYLTGYEDSTMRPERNITVCESLVFLSRFYSLDDAGAQAVYDDYGTLVEATVPSSLNWAYDELAVCLAAGIVTQSEFTSLSFASEIKKELLSVFLVRAMQLEEAAKSLNAGDLTFDDAASITEGYRVYVVALVRAGIVEGDDNNNYSPKLSVTRAVSSTMVSRALDYIEDEGISLTIDKYDGLAKGDGIITAITSSSVYLRGYDGLIREYTANSGTKVIVNSSTGSLSSTYVGCRAAINESDGVLISIDIQYTAGVEWLQGTLVYFNNGTTAAAKYIYVTDIATGIGARYTFASDYDIVQNDKESTIAQLTQNNFVTVKLTNGYVSEVNSYAYDTELKGNITAIAYGTTVTLKLGDSTGRIWVFYLDLLDLPSIYRGSAKIGIDRLSVGSEITVSVKNGVVGKISISSSQATITGQLTSITTTTSGTSWLITTDAGSSATYTLDAAVVAYSGTTAIAISAIGVGDEVSVIVYDGVITEVYLESAYSATAKLSATVLLVDASGRTITSLCDGKLVYIDCTSVSYIIKAATGASVRLADVPSGAYLTVYGYYTSTGKFQATSIVIEA